MQTSKPHWVEEIVQNMWNLRRSRWIRRRRIYNNEMPEVADDNMEDEFETDSEEDNDD